MLMLVCSWIGIACVLGNRVRLMQKVSPQPLVADRTRYRQSAIRLAVANTLCSRKGQLWQNENLKAAVSGYIGTQER